MWVALHNYHPAHLLRFPAKVPSLLRAGASPHKMEALEALLALELRWGCASCPIRAATERFGCATDPTPLLAKRYEFDLAGADCTAVYTMAKRLTS